MTSLIGKSLGRYQIIDQLGEGGMAVVYRAFDLHLERDVAIKVILPGKEHTEKFLKRFEREAQALASLDHPNIVKVIDYGEHDGLPYLVMEYIPSGTLKQKMSGKPMPWKEAIRFLIPIAKALVSAHENKIIHRDVKPSNILITESGEPMLSDFGIAKILEAEETMDLTGTGVGVGTPEYMSPEQAQGKLVDGRSDVYSLGIALYEMSTGRKPYQADTPYAVVIKHVTEPLPNPRSFMASLPDVVENMLFKALAKDPRNRYQSMDEFRSALERSLSETNQGRQSTRSRLFIACIAGGLIILMGLSFTAYRLFVVPKSLATSSPELAINADSTMTSAANMATAPMVFVTQAPRTILPSTSSISINSVDVYDDFNDPDIDGSYDPSLWKIQYGSSPRPIQQNGSLSFSEAKTSNSPHEIALVATNTEGSLSLSDIGYLQADLALGGNANSQFSHVAINMVVANTAKGDFWIEADLVNSTNHPALLCKISYYGAREVAEYNKTVDLNLEYDQFYTIRIDPDPLMNKISWYLNEELICEFTSEEYPLYLQSQTTILLNSFRSTGAVNTNYVDNFVVVR